MWFVHRTGVSLAFLAIVLAGPAPARADILLTPFVGGNLFGSASAPLADVVGDGLRTTFGGSVAVTAGGIFGVEGDVGFTPKFFGTNVNLAGFPVSLAHNNVLTAMANVTVGIPLQGRGPYGQSSGPGVRPYAVAGLGLIRQQLDLVGLFGYSVNDLGYDLGGGVDVFLTHNVGIRGDFRYFRSLSGNTVSDLLDLQPGAFNFSRVTVGVTFRY
jgi:opacity protein-like surface antigen